MRVHHRAVPALLAWRSRDPQSLGWSTCFAARMHRRRLAVRVESVVGADHRVFSRAIVAAGAPRSLAGARRTIRALPLRRRTHAQLLRLEPLHLARPACIVPRCDSLSISISSSVPIRTPTYIPIAGQAGRIPIQILRICHVPSSASASTGALTKHGGGGSSIIGNLAARVAAVVGRVDAQPRIQPLDLLRAQILREDHGAALLIAFARDVAFLELVVQRLELRVQRRVVRHGRCCRTGTFPKRAVLPVGASPLLPARRSVTWRGGRVADRGSLARRSCASRVFAFRWC